MNAYSIIHNYDNQPLYSPDFNFINTALSYKQQKLDLNRAKLQNLYNQYDSLKVHNDVDQEYIEGRLKEVMDITDRYASMDLSDDNFASSLMANVNQVLDEKVKNAVVSTKIIQAEDAEWAKHKGTDKYSDLNRAYVLENSDRRNYESAQEAGVMYQGGAGFKEYVDVGKIFSENIPKLEKVLGAKWVTKGGKEGYFETLETHEGIPKEKISAVFDTLLNDKAKDQLRINAWGTYDKLPDEAIKQDWENFYKDDKDNLKNDIKNLELVISNPKYKAESAKYKDILRAKKEQLNELDNYSFESVMQNNGRKAAINTLYQAKFKNQILDTYSSDNVTDIKINEAQKESLYYDLKLKDAARADAELKLKEKKLNLEIAKLEREAKGDEVVYGDVVPMGSEGVEKNYLKDYYTNQSVTYNNMLGMLKKNGVSDEEARKALRSPEFLSQLKNPAGRKYLKVGDKNIDVVANNKTITDYTNTFIVESGTDKLIKNRVQGIVDETQNTLAVAKDVNIYKELPNFNFKIQNGKYVYTDYKQGSHNYAYLLKQKQKGELTKDQKESLDLYTALHLFNDPNISTERKKVTKDYINSKISNLDPSVAKNLSLEVVNEKGKRIKNTHTIVGSQATKDLWLTDIESDDINAGTTLGRSFQDFVAYETADPTLRSNEKKGINTVLKDQFGALETEIEKAQGLTYGIAEGREVIYNPKNSEYSKILDLAGITDTKYDRKVKLEPIMKSYVPTGDYKVVYEKKSTEKGKTSQWVPAPTKEVTKEELQRRGIAVSDFKRNNRFDARRPEYAASLDLGNNTYDDDKLTSFAMSEDPKLANRYVILTDDVVSSYINSANDLGENYKKEMQRVIKSFSKGEYNFKLNPKQDNTYHLDMYRGNSKFHSIPTYTATLDEQVPTLIKDPRTYIEYGFVNYLDKKLEEMTRDYIENN